MGYQLSKVIQYFFSILFPILAYIIGGLANLEFSYHYYIQFNPYQAMAPPMHKVAPPQIARLLFCILHLSILLVRSKILLSPQLPATLLAHPTIVITTRSNIFVQNNLGDFNFILWACAYFFCIWFSSFASVKCGP